MRVYYQSCRRNHGAKRSHRTSGINHFGVGKKHSLKRKKPWALRNPNRADEEPKGYESTKQEDTCGIWVGGREDECYSGLNKHPRVKNACHGPLQDHKETYALRESISNPGC